MGSVSNIIAGALIGLGVASAGYMAGDALIKSRSPRNVTVKGLSERDVKADFGFWPVRFVSTGPTLEVARAKLETSEAAVKAFLLAKGFADTDLSVQNIQVEDRLAGYNAQGTPEDTRFVLTEDILVRSIDVQKLADASRSIGDLLRSGVVFSSDAYNAGPSYVFTKVADLKGEMLAEATKRAREAAQKFAQGVGRQGGRHPERQSGHL